MKDALDITFEISKLIKFSLKRDVMFKKLMDSYLQKLSASMQERIWCWWTNFLERDDYQEDLMMVMLSMNLSQTANSIINNSIMKLWI